MIDVAFTRADLRRADVAVVIDALRATSTATQALAAGYRRVLCAESIERARELQGPGRVLAGERHCVMPAGFDQGNSPMEAIDRRGEELVLATTNGAPTIVAATRHAPYVLLGSLLNLGAILRALQGCCRSESNVQIVCSGTDGAVALEDVYVAGRLSAGLDGVRMDAALVAEGVARGFETSLEALESSTDARVLSRAGLTGDIAYCALESELHVIPAVVAVGPGVAVVADRGPGGSEAVYETVDADDPVTV
jgi:2-phosphosulfolactate phosphatase